jgi:hypothetical protein
MNLMSGSTLHQKIISVGKDPMIEESRSTNMHRDLYRNQAQQPEEEKQALTFTVVQKHQSPEGEFPPSD